MDRDDVVKAIQERLFRRGILHITLSSIQEVLYEADKVYNREE